MCHKVELIELKRCLQERCETKGKLFHCTLLLFNASVHRNTEKSRLWKIFEQFNGIDHEKSIESNSLFNRKLKLIGEHLAAAPAAWHMPNTQITLFNIMYYLIRNMIMAFVCSSYCKRYRFGFTFKFTFK